MQYTECTINIHFALWRYFTDLEIFICTIAQIAQLHNCTNCTNCTKTFAHTLQIW